MDIDNKIDIKTAKFWVLFSDSRFKNIRKNLNDLANSRSSKIENAKEKVIASLYTAQKSKNLSENVDGFGNETFEQNGEQFYRVNGKTFNNFVQIGDKVVYFNGQPEGGFSNLSKLISNPPKGSEVISLDKQTVDKINSDNISKMEAAKAIIDAAQQAEDDYNNKPTFLWMSQEDVDDMKQELFGSETKDEVERGYGLFDAILSIFPAAKMGKTTLAASALKAPAKREAIKQATTSVLKHGAGEAAVGVAGIGLDHAADAIADASIDSTNVAQLKQNVANDLTVMQKTASMAGSVGKFLGDHAVTIGSLAAITIALLATKDQWLGYLKNLFRHNKNTIVAKCIFTVDDSECKLDFDIDKMKWMFETKNKNITTKDIQSSTFFNKTAIEVQKRLNVLHKSLDLPDLIANLSKDQEVVEIIDVFKQKWPSAKNNIFDIAS